MAKTFRITTTRAVYQPPTYITEVIAETDDWLEAESIFSSRIGAEGLRMEGTHPSHDFKPRAPCSKCGSPQGGCFKSHMPCGYDGAGRSMHSILDDYHRSKAASLTSPELRT